MIQGRMEIMSNVLAQGRAFYLSCKYDGGFYQMSHTCDCLWSVPWG